MTDQLVTPVILCGGAGTRLWPVSREKMPKHFVPLIGNLTTFQQVLDRVTRDGLFAAPIIITNSDFRFVVAEQTRARSVKATIILEPQRRDSAAAIAAVAEFAIKSDPNAILLVIAADHLIPDVDAFAAACRTALPAATAGAIVTFGVEPTYPATSYGYISAKPRTNGSAVCEVAAFVEKPDEATATGYIRDGYLWNSDNFMFRADIMLRELARFEPAIMAAAKGAVDNLVSISISSVWDVQEHDAAGNSQLFHTTGGAALKPSVRIAGSCAPCHCGQGGEAVAAACHFTHGDPAYDRDRQRIARSAPRADSEGKKKPLTGQKRRTIVVQKSPSFAVHEILSARAGRSRGISSGRHSQSCGPKSAPLSIAHVRN